MDGAAVTARTATAGQGLTSAAAVQRLAVDGPNVLPEPRPPSALRLLAEQLTHFFALLLWGAAVLALVGGMPVLAVAVVVVVLVNGAFAFAQEWRADRAAQGLRRLLPTSVTVRRDGRPLVVPAASLVRDDVVLLEPGDRVSADLELATGGIAVDESMLTGESVPVRRGTGEVVHAGTFVVEGAAEAVVRGTAGATRLAGIAAMTRATRHRPGPLAAQLARVVRIVAVIALSAGGTFFALSLVLGMPAAQGFLFAVGVSVALVPEGLLPTVTLSLARAAQRMAHAQALVRRLDAVESVGATTFVCSDKTGTLTQNRMTVVAVWTPAGPAEVSGEGYEPVGEVSGPPEVREHVAALALAAVRASSGRVSRVDGVWTAAGDPMEVALHVLALRCGVDVAGQERARPVTARFPFDPRRRRMSAVAGTELLVKGAPDAVLPLCPAVPRAAEAWQRMTVRGLRVLAVARRDLAAERVLVRGWDAAAEQEGRLELLGLVGIEDPPRPDVREALAACRQAGVRVAMITGDHPDTARAVAAEVGLLGLDPRVLVESELPADESELGALLDHDGVVVSRVTPEGKLRIARALKARGHVVAMTGDGVNDGPALREADVGIAMGLSGTDTAREAADLVLLDDHFATIVTAIEQGRATFANIRRFLTYHLTDNVAELTPFVVWAASGGSFPLALTVLQVLALDIGTDLLPALALGGEKANPRTMSGALRTTSLVDRGLLTRVFGVLGPAEALVEMAAFTAVLVAAGWTYGRDPDPAVLATASGAAFAAVVLGQLANAYACRSETRWVGMVGWRGNPLLAAAVVVELVLLAAFLSPPLATVLGGSVPPPVGWAVALLAVPAVVVADTADKWVRARRRPGGDSG